MLEPAEDGSAAGSSAAAAGSPATVQPILLVAVEGLCARLSAVLSYRLIAIEEERHLFVVWTPDAACDGSFLDHFLPLPHVTFITPEEASALPAACTVPRTIDFHERLRHHAGLEAHCFAALVPKDEVAAAVESNMRQLGSEAAAVHVRRTDHFALSCDRVTPTSDVEISAFLEAPAHVARPIFLATDNAATQRRYRERYGPRLCALTSMPDTSGGASDPLRHSSLRAAVVDLLTCARCAVFKGCSFSSFSDAIAHVRRATGTASALDEHEPSGLWQLQRAPAARPLLARSAGGWWASDAGTHAAHRLSNSPWSEAVAGVHRGGGGSAAPASPPPLCTLCCATLLGAAYRTHLLSPRAQLQGAIDLARATVDGATSDDGLQRHTAAARWLESAAVQELRAGLPRTSVTAAPGPGGARPAMGACLDRLCRALFACGCVGAGDHPRLASYLGGCGGLRDTMGAALLVTLWAVAQRSYLSIVAALEEASRRYVEEESSSAPSVMDIADGDTPQADEWLSTWRSTRLVALRDGAADPVAPGGPHAAARRVVDAGTRSTSAADDSAEHDCAPPPPPPASLQCWRCLAPVVGDAWRSDDDGGLAAYCSPACRVDDAPTQAAIGPLVRQALPPNRPMDAPHEAALVAETYCAWRSGCPGWRSTHLDRRPSLLEHAAATPLYDKLPFVAQEAIDQLYGGMYGGVEDE